MGVERTISTHSFRLPVAASRPERVAGSIALDAHQTPEPAPARGLDFLLPTIDLLAMDGDSRAATNSGRPAAPVLPDLIEGFLVALLAVLVFLVPLAGYVVGWVWR